MKQTLSATGDAMDVLSRIYFFDKNKGFARFMNISKNKAKLYSTANGGGQWTLVTDITFTRYKNTLNQPSPFYNMTFLNKNYGIICYTSATTVKAAIHTTDGGQSWIQDTISKSVPGYNSADYPLEKIQILGIDNAYAIVKGVLVSTSSSGIFTSTETKNNSVMPVSIFPNPVGKNSLLNTEFPSALSFSVKIYNVLGKTVYERDEIRSGHLTVDAGNLTTGMYFVHLKGEKETITKKIIIH